QDRLFDAQVAAARDPPRLKHGRVDDPELPLDRLVIAEGGAGGGPRRPRQILQLPEHRHLHEEAAVARRLDLGHGAVAGALTRRRARSRRAPPGPGPDPPSPAFVPSCPPCPSRGRQAPTKAGLMPHPPPAGKSSPDPQKNVIARNEVPADSFSGGRENVRN